MKLLAIIVNKGKFEELKPQVCGQAERKIDAECLEKTFVQVSSIENDSLLE